MGNHVVVIFSLILYCSLIFANEITNGDIFDSTVGSNDTVFTETFPSESTTGNGDITFETSTEKAGGNSQSVENKSHGTSKFPAMENEEMSTVTSVSEEGAIDLETYRARLDKQTKDVEKGLQNVIKGVVKNMLPNLMNFNNENPISTPCARSLMKYISGLSSVKVWAITMLDATSKPPSGILAGTLNEFGAFDQCLDVELPTRNGKGLEFRGQYCAIEAQPFMPPVPGNFTLSKTTHAHPLASIAEEIKHGGIAFHYLKFRLGICVPSLCSVPDMQLIAKQITKWTNFDVKIPQCYVKEGIVFKPIHIAVICILSLLLIACIYGSIVDFRTASETEDKKITSAQRVFVCFSLGSNFRRLLSASKGSEELKVLHGLRAFSMAWVILGHTYVWLNFQLLRGPNLIVTWFNDWHFEAILNAWLSVEPFFFLSGLLTSYAAMKLMPKTKGKINVPFYIFRRYLRLTPPLLLVIGLAYFMPLISSGPFWYERVDPELRACSAYWWRSLLYISNWTGIKSICVHPTWYLSADFQLHVISIVVLYALYRSPKLGFTLIAALVAVCSVTTGVITYLWDLPPTIQISSGNNGKIEKTIDVVHMRTFTHAGPYYVGIIAGYLLVKCKDVKMGKLTNGVGWCLSIVISISSLYGAHRWNIGEPHGPLLTAIFAALHRTTFTIGVAWVAFACVTGHGGPVNRILSSSLLAPVSRLTFMIYLMHSLVIWVRMASLRERINYSHYNLLYEYMGNIIVSLLLTVPFYLLLEAPLSNLERLAFTRKASNKEGNERSNGHLQANDVNNVSEMPKVAIDTLPSSVELTAVKCLVFENNGFVK